MKRSILALSLAVIFSLSQGVASARASRNGDLENLKVAIVAGIAGATAILAGDILSRKGSRDVGLALTVVGVATVLTALLIASRPTGAFGAELDPASLTPEQYDLALQQLESTEGLSDEALEDLAYDLYEGQSLEEASAKAFENPTDQEAFLEEFNGFAQQAVVAE